MATKSMLHWPLEVLIIKKLCFVTSFFHLHLALKSALGENIGLKTTKFKCQVQKQHFCGSDAQNGFRLSAGACKKR